VGVVGGWGVRERGVREEGGAERSREESEERGGE